MAEDYYTHQQSIKGGSQCSGTYLDFSNSSGTDIRPLFPKGHGPNPNSSKLSCAGAAIEYNVCRHAFQNNLTSLVTADATGCCSACASFKPAPGSESSRAQACNSWNFFHEKSAGQGHNCWLKSDFAKANGNKTQCDSGVRASPDAPGDDDYSAILFSREAQRIIRRHVQLYGDGDDNSPNDEGSDADDEGEEDGSSLKLSKPLFMYLPFQVSVCTLVIVVSPLAHRPSAPALRISLHPPTCAPTTHDALLRSLSTARKRCPLSTRPCTPARPPPTPIISHRQVGARIKAW